MDLKGKVAIVTGAGRGLGWGIAERLAQDGASLVIAEVDPKSGEEKAGVVSRMGREALFLDVDVSRWVDVEKMAKKVVEKFGRIDILVNNAGLMGNYYPVIDYPEEEWDRLIDVNLKGIFLCCKAVLPVMIRQKYGKVISLSSVAGKEGNARMPAYSASKAAVMALTKTMAKEVASYSINVNCISPALCETDMAKDMTPEQRALLISKIPMGRLGKVEEVAALVKFLASDESSFVTGQCYDISGGRSVY
ncbi:MAG: 3-oxoacyl-ACP reductase FabG [Deltaproteobacteria bacterium]|jgi:NAD(P)-dependent dehydrogenase (short-subunit alcohol dehydrogenase family)|nr:MAG: 3-oxoacyl-ACP reductase FabG [Deltaproteobacteria bacterium]